MPRSVSKEDIKSDKGYSLTLPKLNEFNKKRRLLNFLITTIYETLSAQVEEISDFYFIKFLFLEFL